MKTQERLKIEASPRSEQHGVCRKSPATAGLFRVTENNLFIQLVILWIEDPSWYMHNVLTSTDMKTGDYIIFAAGCAVFLFGAAHAIVSSDYPSTGR